jgi:hypothetical protein
LSIAPGAASAEEFVDLALTASDDFEVGAGFHRTSHTTGLGANSGVSDMGSLPFDSIGPNASGGGIVNGKTFGFALPGLLGVTTAVDGSTFGSGQAAGFIDARATAAFTVSITLSPPAGSSATTVSGTLPLFVDGLFGLDATYGGPASPFRPGLTEAEYRLQIQGFLQGSIPLGQGAVRATRSVDGDGDVTLGGETSGILSGYPGGMTTAVLSIDNAPVNVPLSFRVTVFAEAMGRLSHADSFSGIMEAFVAFEHTVSFRPASVGTAFDLPPGFTANSTEANIVDNRWLGIPEPATARLLGVATVLALRRVGRPAPSKADAICATRRTGRR